MTRLLPITLLGLTLALVPACAAPPPELPTYPWQGLDAALQRMQQRYDAVNTLTARARLTLEQPGGDRVSLNAALIVDRPGRLRAQAWKFDQKAFDLTVTPEGVWLWLDEAAREKAPKQREADDQGGAMRLLMRAFTLRTAEQARLVRNEADGEHFVLALPLEAEADARALRLKVHRRTLTVRRAWVERAESSGDAEPAPPAPSLELDRYRLFGGIALPTRLRARGERSLTLKLRDLVLNADLPDGAFVPPAKAKRLK